MTTNEYAKLRGCNASRVRQIALEYAADPKSNPYFRATKRGRDWDLTLTPAEKQRLRELGVLK
jgi:hypothetical protein